MLDAKGHVLADAQAESDFGDVVTVHLDQSDPNATYYLKVQGATSDVFGIGSYGLAVTFDAASTVTTSAIDSVLRGPLPDARPERHQRPVPRDGGPAPQQQPRDRRHAGRRDDAGPLAGLRPELALRGRSGASPARPTSDYYRIQTADAPSEQPAPGADRDRPRPGRQRHRARG